MSIKHFAIASILLVTTNTVAADQTCTTQELMENERAARYLEWLVVSDTKIKIEGKVPIYLEAAQRIRDNPSQELLNTKKWILWEVPKN